MRPDMWACGRSVRKEGANPLLRAQCRLEPVAAHGRGRRRRVFSARRRVPALLAEQGRAVTVHDNAPSLPVAGQGPGHSGAAGGLPDQPARQAKPVHRRSVLPAFRVAVREKPRSRPATLTQRASLRSSLCAGRAGGEEQHPTALLWTLHFAAQHFAHFRQFTRALALSDEAVAHTPTVVEIQMGKAKILKVRTALRMAVLAGDANRDVNSRGCASPALSTLVLSLSPSTASRRGG